MARWTRTAVAVGTLMLAGCVPDLEVPEASQLLCSADVDCPEGWICRSALGRCARPGGDDVPPGVVEESVSISPSHVRNDAVVGVSFDVDEPLASPPEVVIGRSLRLPLEMTDSDGERYGFVYRPDGTEPEDQMPILVSLVDLAGNRTTDVFLGEVRFDFTAPNVIAGSEGLELVPGADNPLRTVTRVTTGTTVRMRFTVDEALAAEPEVATASPARLVFEPVLQGGGLYVYEHVLDDGMHPQGAYDVEVVLEDLAGNRATRRLELPSPGFVVDTQPPGAPGAQFPDAIVYRRMPYGSLQTGGASSFTVEGSSLAVQPESVVIVYDTPEAAIEHEIGRGQADVGGGFRPIQLRADRPTIYLAAADPAGNLSPLTTLRRGHWTVTLRDKVPGSSFENPTEVLTTTYFTGEARLPEPLTTRGVDETDLGALADPDGGAVAVEGTAFMRRVPTLRSPGAWREFALAYRSGAYPLLMLLGGFAPFGSGYNDQLHVATSPHWQTWSAGTLAMPVRRSPAMAYDPNRSTMVVFGGRGENTVPLNDTWTLGSVGGWVLANPAAVPPARWGHGAAYDARRGRVAIFGGQYDLSESEPGVNLLADLWEYDGSTWINRTPATTPSARTLPLMTYDAASGGIVVVGGFVGAGQSVNDLWLWDGVQQQWQQKASPPAGIRSGLAYEPVRRSVVLFGASATPRLSAWDGEQDVWREVPMAGEHPTAGGVMQWDATRERLAIVDWDGELYELDVGATEERPALIWQIPWVTSGASESVVARIDVIAHASGFGFDDAGNRVDGAEILAWDAFHARWESLAVNDAGPDAAPEQTRVAGALELVNANNALVGASEMLTVAVVPAQTNGLGATYGSVAVEYLEVTFAYY
jgi:hypothetical protein